MITGQTYAQQHLVTFAMYDDVDRGLLAARLSDRWRRHMERDGWTVLADPEVRFYDSRTDLFDQAFRQEGLEVLAVVRGRVARDDAPQPGG